MAFTPLGHSRKRDILSRTGPDLCEEIDISPYFMLHMVKQNILTYQQSQDFMALQTPVEKKQKFLEHLHCANVERFVDFCIILHDVLGRDDIVQDVFGLDINNLRTQKALQTTTCSQTSSPRQTTNSLLTRILLGVIRWILGIMPEAITAHHTPADSQGPQDNSIRGTLPPQLVRGITDHSQFCKQRLMHSNLYDLGDSPAARRIDVAKVYIETNVQEEQEDGKLQEIAARDILRCLPGETSLRVIRMSGPPGSGKTALGRHIVYDWSIDFLNRLRASLPLGYFSTLVYVRAKEISSTVEAAIEENLWCKKVDKNTLSRHVHNGDGIGLVLDAIEEVCNPAVINNIRKYIKERQSSGDGPRVLVTARTGLCNLDSSFFDRFLVVKGFSLPQAMGYIKSYLHGELLEKVLEYVQAHQDQLYPVLTNPLRLHIFCALVSEGEVRLEECDDFSIFKLFVILEQFLIRREGMTVTKEGAYRCYCMCIYGLLHGLRYFPEQLLKDFNIPYEYLVFFVREDKECATGRQVSYTFPNEMMNEYFAARYIETLPLENKKSLLLSVCSKPAFRNLQRIMFKVILQQELHQHDLLKTMVRAILILQHTEHETFEEMSEGKGSKALYDELVVLRAKVQPSESAEMLWREHQQEIDVRDVNDTWERINAAFDNHPGGLKGLQWYSGLGNGVLGHTAECLSACAPKQRDLLTKATTEHLLPYDYKDSKGHHHVCAVGSSRWSEVVINMKKETINVSAWCLEDVTEVLLEMRLSYIFPHYQHTFKPITLNINKYQEMWGKPPSSAFTPDVCEGLTAELQHWSNICNSHQFVYAVGTSRWSEVVINTEQETISVHAWCMEDAIKALRQVRFSTIASLKLKTIATLTVNINKYRDLWGQPPSTSYSSRLAAKLRYWSDKCKSYHFVCEVSGIRWGEVVINTEKKTIDAYAWCVDDAKNTLQQVRESPFLSNYQHTFKPITLHIDEYREMWGQPPSSAFSPNVREGLNAELQHWSKICNR